MQALNRSYPNPVQLKYKQALNYITRKRKKANNHELTGSNDFRKIEFVALCSKLPEQQWILFLHFVHCTLERFQGDENA